MYKSRNKVAPQSQRQEVLTKRSLDMLCNIQEKNVIEGIANYLNGTLTWFSVYEVINDNPYWHYNSLQLKNNPLIKKEQPSSPPYKHQLLKPVLANPGVMIAMIEENNPDLKAANGFIRKMQEKNQQTPQNRWFWQEITSNRRDVLEQLTAILRNVKLTSASLIEIEKVRDSMWTSKELSDLIDDVLNYVRKIIQAELKDEQSLTPSSSEPDRVVFFA